MKNASNWLRGMACLCLLLVGSGCATSNRNDYADPLLNQRRILLFGAIDDRKAELTIKKLFFLDGKSQAPIDLFLQTPGGEMKSAFAIEHTMRAIKSPVNTFALSECNSGGAVLLAAGTGKRHAFKGAMIMVHGLKPGRVAPKEFMRIMEDSHNDFWRQHARFPESWLPLSAGTIHFLTAEQALHYGVVDEVIKRRPSGRRR
jgi:ATP-dependent Clp protease, protease subunit